MRASTDDLTDDSKFIQFIADTFVVDTVFRVIAYTLFADKFSHDDFYTETGQRGR